MTNTLETYRSLVANKMSIESQLAAISADLHKITSNGGPKHKLDLLVAQKAELKSNLREVHRLMAEIKPQAKEIKMRDFGNLFKTHKRGFLAIDSCSDDRYETLLSEISVVMARYQKFSADPSRVNSMRLLAARFVMDLSAAISKGKAA